MKTCPNVDWRFSKRDLKPIGLRVVSNASRSDIFWSQSASCLPHHAQPIYVRPLQWNPRKDTRYFRCRLLQDGRKHARASQSNTSSGHLSRKQIMETEHPYAHSSLFVWIPWPLQFLRTG